MFNLFTRTAPTITAERIAADKAALEAHWVTLAREAEAQREAEACREARGRRVADEGFTWVG